MRSEETRGRPRYGPARHRPYTPSPLLITIPFLVAARRPALLTY